MNIFISGIGGVGMGPLAEIALDAGFDVRGSDLHHSPITDDLEKRGVTIIYNQSTSSITTANQEKSIDWFLHTSALPDNSPEIIFAKNHQIRTSKRDEFLTEFIDNHNLKLIAVAGTHGKTTTTSMLIWGFSQLGIPISFSTGTRLSFAPSGKYDPKSKLFIYETDEYDRNFLHFHPKLALIPALDYDHADIYPSQEDYDKAFVQFFNQCQHVMAWQQTADQLSLPENKKFSIYNQVPTRRHIDLPGQALRQDAFLAWQAIRHFSSADDNTILKILAKFPGAARRFERISDNLYSDYAHHPSEIAATLEKAHEIAGQIIVIYQPHQNIRQHQIINGYRNAFQYADKVYWLPTYLTREDPKLKLLTPADLINHLANPNIAEPVEMNNTLWEKIEAYRRMGNLVILLGAGTIDSWARQHLEQV